MIPRSSTFVSLHAVGLILVAAVAFGGPSVDDTAHAAITSRRDPASGVMPASASAPACVPLGAASGNTVTVSTVAQLQNAVNNAAAGTTVLVQDGTYNLDGAYLRITAPNVTLRSVSGNPANVVLDGNYITTEIVQVVASNVTIAELTLREAYYHPIHVTPSANAHTLNTLIYRTRVIDGAEQQIKINAAGAGYYADNGTIACSHIELTDAGRPHVRNNCYTGGIDAHQARGWTVRDNWIGGFWCASGLSEHGIHFWTGSRDTMIERNTLVDNARGIGCGLLESGSGRTYNDNPCPTASGYVDHYAATVRNNTIFVDRAQLFASQSGFDCGICIWQTCGAKVVHNTVVSTQPPFSSIEWRFGNTVVDLRNNLVSHNLRDRGGADTQAGNLQNAVLTMFRSVANADLHLAPGAAAAIDQGAAVAAGLADGDVDGDPRPAGAARDVGADEFVGASIPRNVTTPAPTVSGASIDPTVTPTIDAADTSRPSAETSFPQPEPTARASAAPTTPSVAPTQPAAPAAPTSALEPIALATIEPSRATQRDGVIAPEPAEPQPQSQPAPVAAGSPVGGDRDWPTLVIAAFAGITAGAIIWVRRHRPNR